MTKTLVIAEIGSSHLGDYNKAVALILAAKNAGADAVKIQMFTPDEMTLDSDRPEFYAKEWGCSLYDLYKKIQMPFEWVPKLQDIAKDEDIELFASVFGPESLKLAQELKMPRYKISSFEAMDLDFVESVAKNYHPIILSTGTLSLTEIKNSVNVIRKYHSGITLLHCVSQYPTELQDVNLRTMLNMRTMFGLACGISDHTEGPMVPMMASVLGADVIEKHLCLEYEGPDKEFSLTPDEFKAMVYGVRTADMVMGEVSYDKPKKYRRAMVATDTIVENEEFKGKVRPVRATGGSMKIGETATKVYEKGQLIEGQDSVNHGRHGKPRQIIIP